MDMFDPFSRPKAQSRRLRLTLAKRTKRESLNLRIFHQPSTDVSRRRILVCSRGDVEACPAGGARLPGSRRSPSPLPRDNTARKAAGCRAMTPEVARQRWRTPQAAGS